MSLAGGLFVGQGRVDAGMRIQGRRRWMCGLGGQGTVESCMPPTSGQSTRFKRAE